MGIDKALQRFYERVAAAYVSFNEQTNDGRIFSYSAWLALYEAKEAARYKLAIHVTGLHYVPDFWQHARQCSLKQAIEQTRLLHEEKKKEKELEQPQEPLQSKSKKKRKKRRKKK